MGVVHQFPPRGKSASSNLLRGLAIVFVIGCIIAAAMLAHTGGSNSPPQVGDSSQQGCCPRAFAQLRDSGASGSNQQGGNAAPTHSHRLGDLLGPPPASPVADSPSASPTAANYIVLECVMLPDRDKSYRLSLDMQNHVVTDGFESPTTFTRNGEFITWHSSMYPSAAGSLNTRTLVETFFLGGREVGSYACERIQGLD
jgi:hypothetical protein